MAGPYRHITTRLESDILILTLELEQVKDYVVAEELRYEMMHAAKRFKRKKIVVDLQNMTFMTSLACVAFIGLKAGVRDNHARIVMCNMSEFIRKVRQACYNRDWARRFQAIPQLPLSGNRCVSNHL